MLPLPLCQHPRLSHREPNTTCASSRSQLPTHRLLAHLRLQYNLSFSKRKMPSLDIIRADPHPEVRPGMFGTLKNDIIAAVVSFPPLKVSAQC